MSAIFKSTQQAVFFSFLIEAQPARDGGSLGMLLDRLKLEATGMREIKEVSTINFSGLRDLEIRGQAAMVRSAVMHLPSPESWALRSRYGASNLQRGADRSIIRAGFSQDRAYAMMQLASYLEPAFGTLSNMAILLLVARVCGECDELRPRFEAIVKEAGSSLGTLHKYEKQIKVRVRSLCNVGIDRLTPNFVRDGLVCNEVEETI